MWSPTRRLVAFFLATALTLSGLPAPAQSQGIRVLLDGSALEFDVPPALLDGRVMVPLRKIFEALGARVDWDPDTLTVVGSRAETRVELTVGSSTARVNGRPVQLSVPPQSVAGRVQVPLRFVSEALDAKVDWDAATRTVTITSPAETKAWQPTDVLIRLEDLAHPDWQVSQDHALPDLAWRDFRNTGQAGFAVLRSFVRLKSDGAAQYVQAQCQGKSDERIGLDTLPAGVDAATFCRTDNVLTDDPLFLLFAASGNLAFTLEAELRSPQLTAVEALRYLSLVAEHQARVASALAAKKARPAAPAALAKFLAETQGTAPPAPKPVRAEPTPEPASVIIRPEELAHADWRISTEQSWEGRASRSFSATGASGYDYLRVTISSWPGLARSWVRGTCSDPASEPLKLDRLPAGAEEVRACLDTSAKWQGTVEINAASGDLVFHVVATPVRPGVDTAAALSFVTLVTEYQIQVADALAAGKPRPAPPAALADAQGTTPPAVPASTEPADKPGAAPRPTRPPPRLVLKPEEVLLRTEDLPRGWNLDLQAQLEGWAGRNWRRSGPDGFDMLHVSAAYSPGRAVAQVSACPAGGVASATTPPAGTEAATLCRKEITADATFAKTLQVAGGDWAFTLAATWRTPDLPEADELRFLGQLAQFQMQVADALGAEQPRPQPPADLTATLVFGITAVRAVTSPPSSAQPPPEAEATAASPNPGFRPGSTRDQPPATTETSTEPRPGTLRVTGVVADARSGTPIPGAKVTARATGSLPFTGEATAGDDGTYQLDVPAAPSYQLTAAAPCYQAGSGQATQSGYQALTLTPVSPPLDSPLAERKYRFFGMVSDASGNPVAGACVSAITSSGTASAEYLTDAGGIFVLDQWQWAATTVQTRKQGCRTAEGEVSFTDLSSEGGPRNAPAISRRILPEYYKGPRPADPHIQKNIILTCDVAPRDITQLPATITLAANERGATYCRGTIGTDPGYVRLGLTGGSSIGVGQSARLTATPVGTEVDEELEWWLEDRFGGTLVASGCTATYIAPSGVGLASQVSAFVHVTRAGWTMPLWMSDGSRDGKGVQRIRIYAQNQPTSCSSAPVTITAAGRWGPISRIRFQNLFDYRIVPAQFTVTVSDVPVGVYTVTVTTGAVAQEKERVVVACPQTRIPIE